MPLALSRLEGRALEESLVAELHRKVRSHAGIRMWHDESGHWKAVTPAEDDRVCGAMLRMCVIGTEMVDGLRADGWVIRRADQFCELVGGIQDGDKHSIDMVMAKGSITVFVEVKWNPLNLTFARADGRKVLDAWLRNAALGCKFVYPSGARRAEAATAAAVLAASPYSWSLQIDGDAAESLSGRFSRPCTSSFTMSRGRSGTSGSAKRSRSSAAKATETSYRRGEGRAAHNRWAREGMRQKRATSS